MADKAIFEVCAFNIQSAIVAQRAGAARVELCDNQAEGGTTPSYGAIKQARQKITIALYPIIRPRPGNYLYDDNEYEIIKADVGMCKQLGCDGISIGFQNIDGTIDTKRFKEIVALAYPMGVTCNRVFDATPDAFKALEDLIETGCERILTSGQQKGAPEAGEMLCNLITVAENRITIMPGAGINSTNIKMLMQQSGAIEFHGSAKKIIENKVHFTNDLVSDFGQVYLADEEEIKKIIAQF